MRAPVPPPAPRPRAPVARASRPAGARAAGPPRRPAPTRPLASATGTGPAARAGCRGARAWPNGCLARAEQYVIEITLTRPVSGNHRPRNVFDATLQLAGPRRDRVPDRNLDD